MDPSGAHPTEGTRMKRFDRSFSFSGLFSGENRKPTLILLWVPLLLTTWKYYGSKGFYLQHLAPYGSFVGDPAQAAEIYAFASALLLLGVVSLLIIKFVFKEPLRNYGLTLGDWRFSLLALAVLLPVMAVISYPSSKDPQFLAEYPLFKGAGASAAAFAWHAIAYLFFYIGWEIFFRGFMQFGLREKFGDWFALLIQTGFACIVHIGKPDGEIYSSILGSLIWGLVAFRSRSLLTPILTHWVLGLSLDFYVCFL
jgi:membrane protease YdiL (CAAX protease family)